MSFTAKTIPHIQHNFNKYFRKLLKEIHKLNLKYIWKSRGTRKTESTLRKTEQFLRGYITFQEIVLG
jgi:hypothetical protein